MNFIKPLSWFSSSLLIIFLYSIPCIFGIFLTQYIFSLFYHYFYQKKFEKNINNEFLNEKYISLLIIIFFLQLGKSIFNSKAAFLLNIKSTYLITIYSAFTVLTVPFFILLNIIIDFVTYKIDDYHDVKQMNTELNMFNDVTIYDKSEEKKKNYLLL
jgi:hypothetical protein